MNERFIRRIKDGFRTLDGGFQWAAVVVATELRRGRDIQVVVEQVELNGRWTVTVTGTTELEETAT